MATQNNTVDLSTMELAREQRLAQDRANDEASREEERATADEVAEDERDKQSYFQELTNAREGAVGLARRLVAKLNKEIAMGNDVIAFEIAISLAILKDGVLDILLDFFGIGLIPIIGQIPGWFLSAFFTYFLWGKGWFNTTKIRIVWWSFGF